MKRNIKGFTLIEVMVVVVILGILAAFVVPQIMSRPDEAKMVKAQQDVIRLESALDLYRLDNGQYPTQAQGLSALVSKPTTPPIPTHYNASGYLKRLPKDPWGHDYQYRNPGIYGDADVFSFGADGREGGEGVDKDIGNWQSN
jgi:general secretion pathway protein G